ncbi:MAG: Sortase-like acyltransferase [Frankiales bacterium]|jgi:ribosomal protein S18 acetylase RimI-like enzyme|nr:Sortase-like acyltransferase [Frankiales bacterium]
MTTSTASAAATLLAREHADDLRRFFDALPDEDVTVVKEDVRDPAWAGTAAGDPGPASRWVVLSEQGVVGYAALLPGLGLSSHVGELRLVVARNARRQGLGRLLARTALRAALLAGLSKIVVEVPAEQEGTAEVFRRLGFEGEALLRDHLRDRDGRLRDLLVLAHFAEETSSALSGLGFDFPDAT